MVKQGFDYYTKIINEAIEGLNPSEMGVYLHMRSQNPDPTKWEFDLEYMATKLKVTYYQIRKLVRQLISKGLIERIQKRVHGFIKYEYKVRDRKGEVRDDATLMKKHLHKGEEIKEKPTMEIVEKVETVPTKAEGVAVKKTEWKVLFEGNEQLIDKFIADRKKWLSNCDHYKKLGRLPFDLEVENHINRKLNEINSDMGARIIEFIEVESKREKAKIEVQQQSKIPEWKRLENEMKDKIHFEQIAVSRKLLPNFWEKVSGSLCIGSLKEKIEAEQVIRKELDEITGKYQTIYNPLIEKAKNE
jgi:predicted transcriptional regulator